MPRIMGAIFFTAACWGQSFDVASVKPCDPHRRIGSDGGGGGRGSVDFNCQTLLDYIRNAYGRWAGGGGTPAMGPFNIVGGPGWINRDRFEIHARAESSPSVGTTQGAMMRALLEDRFQVKVHRETREVPIYALVVNKGGVKLPAAKEACFTPDRDGPPPTERQRRSQWCGRANPTKDGFEIHGATMAELCQALTTVPLRMLERRKFVDKTGIQGRFDFDLKLQDDAELTAGDRPTDDFVRLQDALLKVGLRLTSAKGQDEFIVIDRAEHPSAN